MIDGSGLGEIGTDGGGLGGFDLGGGGLGGGLGGGFGDGFGGSAPAPVNEVFERNMLVLAQTSPHAAALIRRASASICLEWVDSDEADPGLVLVDAASADDPLGMLGLGDLGGGTPGMGSGKPAGRVLASRRRPVTEGTKLADAVDLDGAAGVCVYGFGAGYHCRALGTRLGRMGAVVCFEPDIGLLRGVFERVDHTAWMAQTNFVLVTEADNPSAITGAISGVEAILALGVKVVEHPASVQRLKPYAARFGDSFAKAMRSMRTSVMTTLVRSQASLQNVLMNADHYARSQGLGRSRGSRAGSRR
jgi:hypothetical protein